MKKKKHILVLLLLFLSTIFVKAQTWVPVTNSVSSYSFSLPGSPLVVDSMPLKFYAYKLDSLIAFQVHEMDNAVLDSTLNDENTVLRSAIDQTSGDTLRAIAKMILLISGADLLSVEDVNLSSGRKALDLGLQYSNLPPDGHKVTYIRLFYSKKVFLTFTVTGVTDDLVRFMNYKTQFFNSINY
jgi:hypothetical protein